MLNDNLWLKIKGEDLVMGPGQKEPVGDPLSPALGAHPECATHHCRISDPHPKVPLAEHPNCCIYPLLLGG